MLQSLKSELRYVDVPNAKLAYEVIGEGSGKPPLVMIHGYSLQSTGTIYARLYGHLSEAFTIYALDTRGHGASAHLVEGWTFEQMANDVAAAVRNLGLTGAVHAGHSYGGFLGLLTELRHPGTFSSLCLLAPAAASGGGATPDGLKSVITTEGRNRQVMKDLFVGMYRASPVPAELEQVLDAVTLMDLRVHESYFDHEYPNIDITGALGRLSLPVLHVLGAQDVVVRPDEQHLTASLLSNSKEVIFSDEGHMLPLENPERTAREVIRFVHDLG